MNRNRTQAQQDADEAYETVERLLGAAGIECTQMYSVGSDVGAEVSVDVIELAHLLTDLTDAVYTARRTV